MIRSELEFIEKIGSGQFGVSFLWISELMVSINYLFSYSKKVVLKAEYRKRKLVAVKKMKPGSKEDEMNFNREAEFMMLVHWNYDIKLSISKNKIYK